MKTVPVNHFPFVLLNYKINYNAVNIVEHP